MEGISMKNKKITAEIEMVAVWCVYSNTNLTDGVSGRLFVKHTCECEATAYRLSKGAYIMGSDAPVRESTAFIINGIIYSEGVIEKPTKDDLAKTAHIARIREQNEQKLQAILRAQELGLSQEDVDLLKSQIR